MRSWMKIYLFLSGLARLQVRAREPDPHPTDSEALSGKGDAPIRAQICYHSSRMQISSPRSSAGNTVSGAAPFGSVHSPDARS
jgi:hypothetical protein